MQDLIYIIEDDESIRELIKMALGSFSYEVAAFECAEDAITAAKTKLPSLFIFDIMLPGIDGISAVKQLREKHSTKNIPILLLTAKSTELDKVVGLDAGADDYCVKPFGVMELAARVRALLRRKNQYDKTISCDSFTLNLATREVFKDNEPIDLTYKEFELLQLLMKNMDRVVPREEILNTIWGYDCVCETRTLDAHIKSLRKKIGDDAESPEYIKTIRSVGYRFCKGQV